MDFGNFNSAKLPEWECHQVFSKGYDSIAHGSFLEVTAFPKKNYPGIMLPWLTGNWGNYKTLLITARMQGHASRFVLSVWDGKGEYIIKNRFEKKFNVDTTWTTCKLPVSGGLVTSGGRRMDMGRIFQVVFFTGRSDAPLVFNIKKIELQ